MSIIIRNELIPLNLTVCILICTVNFMPDSALRIFLAVPFLFFFPGYTFLTTLFPKRSSVKPIERIAYSFALSIAITLLVGFCLNYSPWGINVESVVYSISFFILILSIIIYFRRRKLPDDEKPHFKCNIIWPIAKMGPKYAILWISLIISIALTTGVLIFMFTAPNSSETFTEFYVLNSENRTIEEYPSSITLGDNGTVILGITNFENQLITYSVHIQLNEDQIGEINPITLHHGDNWIKPVNFKPPHIGENQKLEFILFRDSNIEPYLTLHLWINVQELPIQRYEE